jgi:hypothetical protein
MQGQCTVKNPNRFDKLFQAAAAAAADSDTDSDSDSDSTHQISYTLHLESIPGIYGIQSPPSLDS